jgi:hypothetical protein
LSRIVCLVLSICGSHTRARADSPSQLSPATTSTTSRHVRACTHHLASPSQAALHAVTHAGIVTHTMQQQQQQASLYEGSPTGSELEGGGGGSPLKAPTTLATRFFTQAAAAAAKLSSATAPRPGCSSNSSTTQQQQPVVRRVLQVPPIHRSSSIYAAPSEASPHSASSSDSPSLLRVQSQHKGEDSHTSIVDLQHHNGVHVAVEQFVRRGRSSTSTSAGGAGRGPGGCGGGAGGSDGGGGGKDTFWPCTFNLSKVILVRLVARATRVCWGAAAVSVWTRCPAANLRVLRARAASTHTSAHLLLTHTHTHGTRHCTRVRA